MKTDLSSAIGSPPVAVDLFAGAGGLGEGLALAGLHVAAAVELHPQPALTYAVNHPNTSVLFGDLRHLSLELLASKVQSRVGDRKVDVIAGGPPCQGFSTAGKKEASDPRNSLFEVFVAVVEHFRPRLFLMENVPGFKNMHGGQAFHEASRLFAGLGYELVDTVLEAAEFGLPQRRQRFVMVGRLPGEAGAFEWPTRTHRIGNGQTLSLFADGLTDAVTVRDAIGDLDFLEPGWEGHRHQVDPQCDYQLERRGECELLFNHLATRHRQKALKMFSFIREGETISSVPARFRSAKRTMARLDRNGISNSVLALPDDLIHYKHDRIPTVREMARLQSFDDDYVFIGKRTSGFVERRVDMPQYTQVGNAVPPLLGYVLGGAVIRALGATQQDMRGVVERRRRHRWIRGSSGFTGYSLDREAQGEIDLVNMDGDRCDLPTSDDDIPVESLDALVEWKVTSSPPRRGQWAPGVASPRGDRTRSRRKKPSGSPDDSLVGSN